VRLQGVAYRAHNPKWSWSPLSGEGARLHGGRFNAKGVAALYLSLDWQTAIIEASQGFAYRIPPLTIVSYEVDCDDIVDLTSAEERARHRVSEKAMACAWRLLADTRAPVPSWRIAERLKEAGLAGIIVPSYAVGADRDAKNLVLWRWSEELPHRVGIIDVERRLPQNDASWRR
jgi:RES domain-containing protein